MGEKSCGSCRFAHMLKVSRPCRCDVCKDHSEWQAIEKGRNQPVQYKPREEVEKPVPMPVWEGYKAELKRMKEGEKQHGR